MTEDIFDSNPGNFHNTPVYAQWHPVPPQNVEARTPCQKMYRLTAMRDSGGASDKYETVTDPTLNNIPVEDELERTGELGPRLWTEYERMIQYEAARVEGLQEEQRWVKQEAGAARAKNIRGTSALKGYGCGQYVTHLAPLVSFEAVNPVEKRKKGKCGVWKRLVSAISASSIFMSNSIAASVGIIPSHSPFLFMVLGHVCGKSNDINRSKLGSSIHTLPYVCELPRYSYLGSCESSVNILSRSNEFSCSLQYLTISTSPQTIPGKLSLSLFILVLGKFREKIGFTTGHFNGSYDKVILSFSKRVGSSFKSCNDELLVSIPEITIIGNCYYLGSISHLLLSSLFPAPQSHQSRTSQSPYYNSSQICNYLVHDISPASPGFPDCHLRLPCHPVSITRQSSIRVEGKEGVGGGFSSSCRCGIELAAKVWAKLTAIQAAGGIEEASNFTPAPKIGSLREWGDEEQAQWGWRGVGKAEGGNPSSSKLVGREEMFREKDMGFESLKKGMKWLGFFKGKVWNPGWFAHGGFI
ncbi:uncharacterized protein BDR25DRAFT_361411 [Lindgomyces ingoldianus]|uniref:Uncharacterized protein n=1 Tax=Lindgomyces ingoldianus TaxID=673940 RepID=A0ACB6QEK5_9PLEO|nr:uncharacterized protein BDR25DRAFT_361411 [Lindgomyces ingoldianus]KAF2464571.1 hypothetical protein BDR25DRAFT_361411 [Lindgomyces ingoldianus]